MPKQILVIVTILTLAALAQLFTEDIAKSMFFVALAAGVISRIKETLFLLKIYGHIYFVFFTYTATVLFTGRQGVSAEISFNDLSLSPQISVTIILLLLCIFLYLIYCKVTKEYMSRTILPKSFENKFNGDLASCYIAFIIIGSTVFDSLSIKYINHETSNYLSATHQKLGLIRAHYEKTPQEYNEISKRLVKLYVQEIDDLQYIPDDSKNVESEIRSRTEEIRILIENENNKTSKPTP